jgi:hypothetical protein
VTLRIREVPTTAIARFAQLLEVVWMPNLATGVGPDDAFDLRRNSGSSRSKW